MLFILSSFLSVNIHYPYLILSVYFCIFAVSNMKFKGSSCDFTQERDADLLRAYREIISGRDNFSLSEIERRILQSPSRRFWVSEGRAYRVILDLLKGKSIDYMIPTRKAMFMEIFRRFQIYSKEHPSLTKMEIIWHICNEEAPSFYLTQYTIHVILCRVRKEEKKRCYEKRKRRLKFMFGSF